ncbi:MAG TPA: MaoC family dehydratase [Verrucomicrobiae bacterium]|nr:MaoC family dehydratase [Verrucomicrobiae bacterium]
MKQTITALDQFEALRGTLVESDWLTIDQDAIATFADVTNDHQWIHLDAARAATESPYGTTVAHGFLTLSMLPALLSQCSPFRCAMVLNYGFDRIRFIGPVPSGSRIRGAFTLVDVRRSDDASATLTWQVEVTVEGGERPALAAMWLQRAYV